MTGEIVRCFWRHKVFGDGAIYAVEIDPVGHILAAKQVEAATICPHMLPGIELDLDAGERLTKERRDYELHEPACHDATHLLGDIGTAEKECQAAEEEWKAAHGHAKALKETFELKQDKLRQIVRDSTNPKPLPLFANDTAA